MLWIVEAIMHSGFQCQLFNHIFRNDLSNTLNATGLVYGVVIVGGLLVLSFALYMLDSWATSR